MKKNPHRLVSLVFFLLAGAVLVLLLDLFVFSSPLTKKLLPSGNAQVAAAPVPEVHEEPHALVLSRQALRNIGIIDEVILPLDVAEYDKTMSFPAMVVNRPGRSTFRVPAPTTGVVRKVHIEPGMVVQPGQPLFELSLTHEDLIGCQNDLIALFQKRDVLLQELERLEALPSEIVPRTKRDLAFQQAELDSQIETQRSILRLHGLADDDIRETVEHQRRLIKTLTVYVPATTQESTEGPSEGTTTDHDHAGPVVQMETLFVDPGQLVNLGDPLCQLVDLALLYIEGRASNNDETILATALMEHCRVTAYFDGDRVDGLHIRYIDTRIDPATRALRFYVDLPNSVVVRDAEKGHHHGGDGDTVCELHRHYVNWKYRPGQRCELKVEYDTIPGCIVVPREAVAESGSEAFVFEWTGSEPDGERRKIWTKRPVHVLHRSKSLVALANDGSIFPGAKITARGAGQLLVALTSGGGQLQSTCPCGDH